MRILGYLGTGIAHERGGLPCQDAIGARSCENGNTVLALSAGASSSLFAREAARSHVEAVIGLFASVPLSAFLGLDVPEQKRRILAACREGLARLAGSEALFHAPDYAATLLLCVDDGERLLLGHLGDGALFAADENGETVFVSSPENAPEGASRTFFVSFPNAEEHLRLTSLRRGERSVSRVLLMSDGPCAMFQGRGGSLQATAAELLLYVRQGLIETNSQLADVLRQMAELPCERLDDWSLLILDTPGEAAEPLPEPVSMLAEEEEKYAERTGTEPGPQAAGGGEG